MRPRVRVRVDAFAVHMKRRCLCIQYVCVRVYICIECMYVRIQLQLQAGLMGEIHIAIYIGGALAGHGS